MNRWLTALIVGVIASCTSTQKSTITETVRSCGPSSTDLPILTILSSHLLGGEGNRPHRIAYTGGVPALAVLYSSNHLLFAKNVSKTVTPFYSYFCVKLSDAERAGLVEGIAEAMPELFEAFDGKDKNPASGYTELYVFKNEFECSHYELKGGIEAAREAGMRSRSSVAVRVPEELLEALERFSAYDNAQATPWFPDQVLIEMRLITDSEAKAIKGNAVAWPDTFKLTRIKDKEMRLQLDSKTKIYTSSITAAKLKNFSALMRSKILKDGKTWLAGYRLLLPSERLWAGPHPTKGEEYSACNRFAPRTNFWKLYGTYFINGAN